MPILAYFEWVVKLSQYHWRAGRRLAKAVTVERPWLPPDVNKLSLSNIAVGDQVITPKFERLADHVVVSSDVAPHHDVPVMLRLCPPFVALRAPLPPENDGGRKRKAAGPATIYRI
jgi:hypothetical protein